MSKEIVKILMERDGLSESDALDLFIQVGEQVHAALNEGRFSEIEDIISEELSLEPDYLWEFLW